MAETMKALVSVIMPVYNAERFLARSIESVQRQSHEQWELILVDDGSSDNSESICKNYMDEDERIRYLSQVNGGPAAARNLGLDHARGEYIYFLDADDFIRTQTLEQLLDVYQRNQCDLVIGGFSKLIDDKELKPQAVAFSPENISFDGEEMALDKKGIVGFVRHFLHYPSNHLVSYCWSRLYRRDLIERHAIRGDAKMRLFEDYVLNLEYLRHVEKVVYLNQEQYIYTMNSDHCSASMVTIQADSLLGDMEIFIQKSLAFFEEQLRQLPELTDPMREVGHCLIHYSIIFLVRSFWQIQENNREQIEFEVSRFIRSRLVLDHIDYYTPVKGNSWLIPLLIKLGCLYPLEVVCRYKANKRYGILRSQG